MQGTCNSAPKKSVIQRMDAKTGHKERIRNTTRACWGGVRKTKVHLQQKLVKGIERLETSATPVGTTGSLLNRVGECKSFITVIIFLLHI